MINKIVRLKDIGKFEEFLWDPDTPEFNSVNLIFGYNRCGKTTLSNVFRLYSKFPDNENTLYGNLSNSPDSEVIVEINNKQIKYSADRAAFSIYVFNSDFVREHVYEGIELTCKDFDKTNVSGQQLKNSVIDQIDKDLQIANIELAELKQEKDQYLREFELIKQKYSREFNSKILNSRLNVKFPESLPFMKNSAANNALNDAYKMYDLSLKQKEISDGISYMRNCQFTEISLNVESIMSVCKTRIFELSNSEIQERINVFRESNLKHYTVEQWLSDGNALLKYMLKNNLTSCPLCGSNVGKIIARLMMDLSQYFDDSYNNLLANIDQYILELEEYIGQMHRNTELMQTIRLLLRDYGYLSQDMIELIRRFEYYGNIGREIESIILVLYEKKGDIGRVDWDISIKAKQMKIEYNDTIVRLRISINEIIDNMASKLIDSKNCVNEIKGLIQLCIDSEFDELTKNGGIEQFKTLDIQIIYINNKIAELSNWRTSEMAKLGSEVVYVNNNLLKLGIKNFNIIQEDNGHLSNIAIRYIEGNIKRNLMCSLSESEKTTLALAYYMSKIQYEVIDSSKVRIEDVVIIVDDPVSSLDEDRLHRTAWLIWDTFKGAKQLFIMSHNINFMRIINNCIGDHKIKDDSGNNIRLRADYYLCNIRGKLLSLPKELENYRTTYFQRLKALMDYNSGAIKYEDAKYYIGNHIRIVLESYLSFKLGCVSGDSGKFRAAGLEKLIKIVEANIGKFKNYNEVDKINAKNLVGELRYIKQMVNPQAHGTPCDIDEITCIAEKELNMLSRNTINIIKFMDNIHFDRIDQMGNNAN